MTLSPATLKAYGRWQKAVERGYGDKTHIADLRKVDARIRKLKAEYEVLLGADRRRDVVPT